MQEDDSLSERRQINNQRKIEYLYLVSLFVIICYDNEANLLSSISGDPNFIVELELLQLSGFEN